MVSELANTTSPPRRVRSSLTNKRGHFSPTQPLAYLHRVAVATEYLDTLLADVLGTM